MTASSKSPAPSPTSTPLPPSPPNTSPKRFSTAALTAITGADPVEYLSGGLPQPACPGTEGFNCNYRRLVSRALPQDAGKRKERTTQQHHASGFRSTNRRWRPHIDVRQNAVRSTIHVRVVSRL